MNQNLEESQLKVNRNSWKTKRLTGIPIKRGLSASMIEVNDSVIPLTKTRKVLD